MSAGTSRDGLPLMQGGGRSLNQNLDSLPPSYESVMAESHGGKPYAPLPTSSTRHGDTCEAQTHPTNPPYPTFDRPLPSNPDYNSSDPRNETRHPSAPYPTDESVYVPSLPTSSSAFYNPMNQMPSPSGLGISQTTGGTTHSPANMRIGFKDLDRNETQTISPQYPDVARGSDDCQCLKFVVAVIGLIVVIGVGIYVWRWSVQRREMRMQAREHKLNNGYFSDSSYYGNGIHSD